MPLALAIGAVVAVVAFVVWMGRRERVRRLEPWRRTLEQIRELPEHIGHRRIRK